MTMSTASGSLTLELDPDFELPARLIQRDRLKGEQVTSIEPWDSHEAMFDVLLSSKDRRHGDDVPSPSLHDATRAMELAEATSRSLRRGRTVDLHYEAISEEANFKSVMTSTGCMILLGALFAVLFALSGPPLGLNWTIYVAYLVPPILVIFMILQTLRLAVRKPALASDVAKQADSTSAIDPAGPR